MPAKRQVSIKAKRQALKNKNYVLYVALLNHRTHKNKKLQFTGYEYLYPIYADTSKRKVVRKSTQSGVSEYLLCKSMCKASKGDNVFYVLPTDKLKTIFVQDRFNKSIENTKFYKQLTKGMDRKLVESTSLKQVGKGSIFFVGSNSTSAFTSYASDYNVIDEWDECHQDNLKMAPERQSASDNPESDNVGNPTIEDFGIDARYKESDRKKWHIFCDHCGKLNNPDFFKHILKEEDEGEYLIMDPDYEKGSGKDIRPICEHCNKPFYRYGKGIWIPERKSIISGYHINKIFSSKTTIEFLIERFEAGLLNEADMQRFYNGDQGLGYTGKGSQISTSILESCKEDYLMPSSMPTNAVCVMGVDVGSALHIRINQILPDGRSRAVYIGKIFMIEGSGIRERKEVKDLYRRYNCRAGVIDSSPELRLARDLCYSLKGMFRWTNGDDANNPVNMESKKITYDRNLLLDEVKSSFMTKAIILPKNANTIGGLTSKNISEYYDNVSAPTRVLEEYGSQKKKRFVWRETRPDHYAFAEGYAHLAKKIILSARR